MVMRLGIGDRKPDRDRIEERRFGGPSARAPKIRADMKDQFESPDPRRLGADERRVGAPSAFVRVRAIG
jgi:hypothetical protein